MTREKTPTHHAPFLRFQNIYTKHNTTTMLYYINIYITIGLIISALVLLFNGYWVKYDGDKPLTSSNVIMIMVFWPLFLFYFFYYMFVKKY